MLTVIDDGWDGMCLVEISIEEPIYFYYGISTNKVPFDVMYVSSGGLEG